MIVCVYIDNAENDLSVRAKIFAAGDGRPLQKFGVRPLPVMESLPATVSDTVAD